MPDTDVTAYRLLHELDERFDRLVEAIEVALTIYEQQTLPTWAFHQPAIEAGWLRHALLDMWHQEGQDGRETRNYIGVVAANQTLLEAIGAINEAKANISELLQKIKNLSPKAFGEIKQRLPKRHPYVDDVLRQSGFARLHLKQCWRQIPVAEAPVSRIRLAWYSSGRSIKRLSVQEAERKLMDLDTEAAHVRIQLRKLAGLPSGEVLAQVQAQAPLMRANLFFTEPLADGHTRRAFNIAMPLFVPAPEQRLPHMNLPPLHPPTQRTRARRRDEKLEQEPFLPSLRIYRYKDA
ncbi:DNA replication terminus site binding protein [Vreelandella songnenensis]|uniref:DNA replication terminus site binding protein n=1 Tax=Vreelandella songnenensis TaxID=1176243 RepID=A0A2T0V6K2_9GAMM|nr:DNA replication terminus site-binding protein [Halomonas songnenensis]PRY65688.1 DNA replication terminus site binding protein [Halomonas songnenensis]